MAFDEPLAARVRKALKGCRGLEERKMFGGLAFLVRGNMCCGVIGDKLMVRVGPESYDKAISARHVLPMDFTGKPLKGLVYVTAPGIASDRALKAWVTRGLEFARSLPAK
jgi:TfoX/Sxy family transcriptional regulator of competence genes